MALLYIQIANGIEEQIKNDVLKIGDKLPSIRALCRMRGVSVGTGLRTYYELENRGLIEPRPRSGYFVSYTRRQQCGIPSKSRPVVASNNDSTEEILNAVTSNIDTAKIMLSSTMLAPELIPIANLSRAIVQATRTMPDAGVGYNRAGSLRLKNQIARHALSWGGKLTSDDIITTGGSIDSIAFCLLALAKPGDTVAVESPIYFGILRLAQSLRLNVLELPTDPIHGIDIDELRKGIEHKNVKLCILVSNYSNPMGSCMSDDSKREVVRLMEKHNIPLIEDDIYADLHYGEQRPNSCKTFDESGIVLWCNSVSKTLAAGYRVGWVAPGKFKDAIARVKMYHTMFSSTITHEAVGLFMESGRYESHLRKLRPVLQRNAMHFLRCINEYFPDDTKVTRPTGSMNLWVELNKNVDTVDVYNRAISERISIAPGRTYSLQNQYNNQFKISFGQPWTDKVEQALKDLGRICKG